MCQCVRVILSDAIRLRADNNIIGLTVDADDTGEGSVAGRLGLSS